MSLYLVDKSAFEQQRHSRAADELLRILAAEGRLAVCEMVALELLHSTRGAEDYESRRAGLESLIRLPMDHDVARMALDIQRRLVHAGLHRRPIPDLLIAATALVHEATVLHYDKDFDLIASVTGQPARWIIPRGTGHGS
ncbi:MAG: PIN domain-containing protein [Schumannella sp.]